MCVGVYATNALGKKNPSILSLLRLAILKTKIIR